jgi:hypothetical protein
LVAEVANIIQEIKLLLFDFVILSTQVFELHRKPCHFVIVLFQFELLLIEIIVLVVHELVVLLLYHFEFLKEDADVCVALQLFDLHLKLLNDLVNFDGAFVLQIGPVLFLAIDLHLAFLTLLLDQGARYGEGGGLMLLLYWLQIWRRPYVVDAHAGNID